MKTIKLNLYTFWNSYVMSVVELILNMFEKEVMVDPNVIRQESLNTLTCYRDILINRLKYLNEIDIIKDEDVITLLNYVNLSITYLRDPLSDFYLPFTISRCNSMVRAVDNVISAVDHLTEVNDNYLYKRFIYSIHCLKHVVEERPLVLFEECY